MLGVGGWGRGECIGLNRRLEGGGKGGGEGRN